MEKTLTAILEQVPALCVLAWVVTFFLRHMATMSKDFAARAEKRDDRIADLVAETRGELHETRQAIGRVTEVFSEVHAYLKRVNGEAKGGRSG